MAAWTQTTDEHGWHRYERGVCRITVSPNGAPVLLIAQACATYHATVEAAKRAASGRLNRGW